MHTRTIVLTLVLLVSLVAAARVVANDPRTCLLTRERLDGDGGLVDCIKGFMPRKHCNLSQPRRSCALDGGFVVPDLATLIEWDCALRDVVWRMLEGECDGISLPPSLSGYMLATFQDRGNKQEYCVLMETEHENRNELNSMGERISKRRVRRGWGTFIVNPLARRELSIQIPHPIMDDGTLEQGILVFKETNARSFLLAGTDRRANAVCSSCQPKNCAPGTVMLPPGGSLPQYVQADVAHNVRNLFHVIVRASRDFYRTAGIIRESIVTLSFVAMQFHGHQTTTCRGEDVYMTYGFPPPEGNPTSMDTLDRLQTKLCEQNPSWKVSVPGGPPTMPPSEAPWAECPVTTPACNLHGSNNVQGRLFNSPLPFGYPACILYFSALRGSLTPCPGGRCYNERFIHIEQKPDSFRNATNWNDPIKNTFPEAEDARPLHVPEHFRDELCLSLRPPPLVHLTLIVNPKVREVLLEIPLNRRLLFPDDLCPNCDKGLTPDKNSRLSIVGGFATVDGTDVTEALMRCITPGTRLVGNPTFHCSSLLSKPLAPGTHSLHVILDLSDGNRVSDTVTWEVLDNTEWADRGR